MLLLTAAETRELDRLTIEGGHAAGGELMRRAGTGLVAAIERRHGSLLALRVLVLCGTGNNGGDGFVAAVELLARGAVPRVVIAGEESRVSGDARGALDDLRRAGLEPVCARDEAGLAAAIAGADHWDLALDALLGTGARGGPEGMIADGVQALRELDERGTRVVAVDLPTGVNADTGEIARRAVRADFTVTFGAPKRGHLLYPARAFCGTIEVVDIGLVPPPAGGADYRVRLATPADMAALLPARDPRAHKGSTGRLLVVGGSPGLTGAVALAARAASRAGAGYVQAAVPASLHDILEVKLTEEMTVPCPETAARTLAAAALESLREHEARVDAIALGSGLSRHPESAGLARVLAREARVPVVVDADALNALAAAGGVPHDAPAPRVLTPHPGEMARLTGAAAGELERDRIDAPRAWAARWNSVVLFKGAPTVAAGPDGSAWVNPTGHPGMATAGMGDVLTGVVATFLAQGVPALEAAALGAFVHGVAGERAAAARGRVGITAGDVAESLPAALEELARLRDAEPRRAG
jgi:NAD(P)H-hydrate epimerase